MFSKVLNTYLLTDKRILKTEKWKIIFIPSPNIY